MLIPSALKGSSCRLSISGVRDTAVVFTDRLGEDKVDPSVGSVGVAYDNPLVESQIGSTKPS
jgi:putative transposase